ncbi:MAG: ABC transporter permease [Chloroflexi bacterium]|nr:ABC transporter permease [Chloroflexota bacterium]
MTAAAVSVTAPRTGLRRQQVFGFVYIGLAAVIAFAFGAGTEAGAASTFDLNARGVEIELPQVVLPSAATAYVLAGLCAFLGAVQLTRGFGTRGALILGVVALLFISGFLVWAASTRSMNLVGVFQTTVQRATPITFAALSGVLCERAGVVNIAIEGMLLSGAFVSAVVGSATANPWIGILGAVIVGALLAALLAVLAIRYRVDQIIAGTVINILAVGVTSFLSVRVLQESPELNSPGRFGPTPIPLLADIPFFGPILFDNNVFIYAMLLLVALIHVALFHTRWGLRVRAVGEHPRAADTVGIDVLRTRYRNVILGGMVAGLGGAFLIIGATGRFDQEMTAGRGFIGLAAMIFGGWTPVGAFLASLVFGFADSLQARLSILNVPIASEILLMAPYVVTILVVAGLVGRARAPAADGRPYHKE